MAKTNAQAERPVGLSELIKRTNKEKPAPADLALLKDHLSKDESFVHLNSAANQAFHCVIKALTNSELIKELYNRNIEAGRKEMNYEVESAMTRMLIDHLILCQIRLSYYESFHAEKIKEPISIKSGLYWDTLLSGYQKRFIKACEALATVKKLLSEADLFEERARSKRAATAASAKIYMEVSE